MNKDDGICAEPRDKGHKTGKKGLTTFHSRAITLDQSFARGSV